MMEVAVSAAIGYSLGQLSPAALISNLKKQDLREYGTGNLGATNNFLVFGKFYGIAVIGHIFPAYLEFHGGKGVATFAGMILAYDVETFIHILIIAIIIMAVTDFRTWGPVSAEVLFPVWLLFKIQNLIVFGGMAAVGGLVIYKHKENFVRAKEGEEILVRDFAGKYHDFHRS